MKSDEVEVLKQVTITLVEGFLVSSIPLRTAAAQYEVLEKVVDFQVGVVWNGLSPPDLRRLPRIQLIGGESLQIDAGES